MAWRLAGRANSVYPFFENWPTVFYNIFLALCGP